MTLTKEMVMGMKAERITKIKKFGDEEIECVYRKCRKPLTKEDLSKMTGTATDTFGFCRNSIPGPTLPKKASSAIRTLLSSCATAQSSIPTFSALSTPPAKSPASFPGAPSASVPATAWTNGKSWAFRRRPFPIWPSSSQLTPLTGFVKVTLLPMSTPAASAIPAAIMSSSALRTAATAMTSSNGSQPSTGAAKSASAATPASPWFTGASLLKYPRIWFASLRGKAPPTCTANPPTKAASRPLAFLNSSAAQ